jgi:hypothetical protein
MAQILPILEPGKQKLAELRQSTKVKGTIIMLKIS